MKKFLVLTIIILVLIVSALAILTKVYVTPDKVKSYLVPYIESSLDRDVDIQSIDIGLFKGIRIKNFVIKEADAKSIFMKCEDFVLKFRFLPLLSKKVLIDELRLSSPSVNILRNTDGKYNFEDMLSHKDQRKQRPRKGIQEEGPPVSLLIKELTLDDVRFSFMDKKKELYDADGSFSLSLQMQPQDNKRIKSTGKMSLAVAKLIRWKKPVRHIKDINANITYSIDINSETGVVLIDKIDVTANDISSSINGSINNLNKSPDIDLSFALHDANAERVMQLIKPYIETMGTDISGGFSVDLKIKGNTGNLDSIVSDGDIKLAKIHMKDKNIDSTIDGSIRFSTKADSISISKGHLIIDNIATDFRGKVNNVADNPSVDMVITLPQAGAADLQRLLSHFIKTEGIVASGSMSADIKIKGIPKKPDSMKTSLLAKLKNMNIRYRGNDIPLSGTLNLKTSADNVSIKKANIQILGMQTSVKGDIKNISKSMSVDLGIVLPRTKGEKIQKAIAFFTDINGMRLSGTASASLKVSGKPRKLSTVRPFGKVTLKNFGVLHNGIEAGLDGVLDFAGDKLKLKLKVKSGNDTAEIKGSVRNYVRNQNITLDITAGHINIDKLLASKSKGSRQPAKKPESPTVQEISQEAKPVNTTLTARGSVKIDSAIYKGMDIKNIEADYKFSKNILTLSGLSADTADGRIMLDGTVDLSVPGFKYDFSVNVKSVKAEKLMKSLYPDAADRVFGSISNDLKIKGIGITKKSIIKNLNSDMSFQILDGKITNIGLADSLSALLNIGSLKTILIKTATGTVKIRNGVAKLQSMFASDDLEMNPSGDIGLDGNLNLSFDLRLSPHLTGKATGSDIAKYISDDRGWGIIPIICPGSFSKPACAPDISRAGTRIIEKEINRALEKLFNKGDENAQPVPQQQTPQQQRAPQQQQQLPPEGKPQKPTIEEPIKELLRQLF